MADEIARIQQYEYRQNSNLVLQVDYNYTDRRGRDEPTGEVMPLRQEMFTGHKMGDKFQRSNAPDEKKTNKKVTKSSKNNLKAATTVLQANEAGSNFYEPRTQETKQTHEILLGIMQDILGDQEPAIIHGAADEVLHDLKTDNIREKDKRKAVETLLGQKLPDEKYALIVNLSKKITDFVIEEEEAADAEDIDENYAVRVQFDDEEDEEDKAELDFEIREPDDYEDDQEGVEAVHDETLRRIDGSNDLDELNAPKKKVLQPRQVNAQWISRQVSKFYTDENEVQKHEREIIDILETAGDLRDCENKLVSVLDAYDLEKFGLVKTLLQNRAMILYCTKLAKAEPDEKASIEAEMAQSPELAAILSQLKDVDSNDDAKADAERRQRAAAKRAQEAGQAAVSASAYNAEPKFVKFDELAFAQGSHFNSSAKCRLPHGSTKTQKKSYESVIIPAQKPKPYGANEQDIPISDLPKWAQPGFKGFERLNRIQSKISDKALHSDGNLLVCAPTGAGKTNCALMCILHEMSKHMNTDGSVRKSEFKCVYIAPMRSLVQEMVGSFKKRLEPYGIEVGEMTGDQQMTKEQFMATQLIVCTPEKYDIITRKGGERAYSQLVRLIIIDEIHLLHDDRGPVLEAIVARTIRSCQQMQYQCRLVGLSATLPNYKDVALFLRVNIDDHLFFFDNSYRPVPLEQEYIGVTEKKAMKRYQAMNEIVYDKVLEHAGHNQVLIFVHSRKETAKTAKAIRDMCLERETLSRFIRDGSASAEILRNETGNAKNPDLADLLPYGFAIHHAGLPRLDRTLAEDLFADKHIQVLVSTATLAWGVNLPAHTVIIKGTQIYNAEKGCWTELGALDVMQMLGRAGRPQYDSKGEGIMITNYSELQFYLSLMNEQLPVESQMITKLPDMLNAEVVLGTVNNVVEASDWLAYTYLYIRMVASPSTYGIEADIRDLDALLEGPRANFVHSAALMLAKGNLVKYDPKSGLIQSTELGRIASHYYCTFESMETYNKLLKETATEIDLFRIFSMSSEFKQIHVREEEKMELQKLAELTPVPIREALDEPSAKINVLLQAYISQLKLEGFALQSDMVFVAQSAGRLFRAIFEIVLWRGWASLALKVLGLCKMVNTRQWQSLNPLHQFKKIPQDLVKVLDNKNITFDRLYDLDAHQLGELIKIPKMGKPLHKFIRQVPKVDLSTVIVPITRSTLKLELTITPEFQWDERVHGNSEGFWIFIEDVNGEVILHHEFFLLKQKYAEDDHIVKMFVPVFDPLPPLYYVRVVSDRWLGSETILPISFRHLILPDKYPPPTELLDLQPLPLNALGNPEFEAIFESKGISVFNPIQTQVFRAFYSTNDNVFLGAPHGSGKLTCAEFALLRHFENNPESKAVYVTLNEQVAARVCDEWNARIGTALNKPFVLLTGETATDLKLLQRGSVIVATADRWDNISRRWKQRKNVQAVKLFIADDLQMMGDALDGPAMEVVCSRMRYMSSQLESKLRIVVLSSSLANAKDVCQWLGCTCFNFTPSVRPIPLELFIQTFNLSHTASRLAAMVRPVYAAILRHGGKVRPKPALVFVPSRRQTRSTADDLITYAMSDRQPQRFLHVNEDDPDFRQLVSSVSDESLAEALLKGIGFIHEGMTSKDIEIVENLFASEAIQVLIVPRTLCYQVKAVAYVVIIMDTQVYNGQHHVYEDYPVSDVLHMMGLANRPGRDEEARVVLMCQANKKDYFKKFLYEPLPLESHLDSCLHDHFNAEVVTKTIENKQDAVDYLTWTFLYRRMTQNPNYYSLQGVTHRHLSEALSELVENTLKDLENSQCIAVKDEMDTLPLNLGIIASYYYISYTTIELFSLSLKPKTKARGLLEIISNASEFANFPVRYKEDSVLKKLAERLPNTLKNQKWSSPHTKVLLLLNAHLSRIQLSAELNKDIEFIVLKATRLTQACVDVLSNNSWLNPAIHAMDLSQMLTQAMYSNESCMKQLPHSSPALLERCKEAEVDSIFALLELEDDARTNLLRMNNAELADVARFCNNFPAIEVIHKVSASKATVGETIEVDVVLDRENDVNGAAPPVVAPFYPLKRKDEGWWVVIGVPETNTLCAIRRTTVMTEAKVNLSFPATTPGKHTYKLYFMCDSYIGADQEFEFTIRVDEEKSERRDRKRRHPVDD
uniref:U5 small nuclear ribonucleoprotein 200 kDa helicase n=1 Tax=Panagrellus redivivus TaxID=6233 RepID=A0A7E4UNZ2_PANRE